MKPLYQAMVGAAMAILPYTSSQAQQAVPSSPKIGVPELVASLGMSVPRVPSPTKWDPTLTRPASIHDLLWAARDACDSINPSGEQVSEKIYSVGGRSVETMCVYTSAQEPFATISGATSRGIPAALRVKVNPTENNHGFVLITDYQTNSPWLPYNHVRSVDFLGSTQGREIELASYSADQLPKDSRNRLGAIVAGLLRQASPDKN